MPYIPHAVIGSTGSLQGTVVAAEFVALPSKNAAGVQYPLYLEIRLVNVPGSRLLRRVRYYGRLEFDANDADSGGSHQGVSYVSYDGLVEDAQNAGVSWANIQHAVTRALNGSVVNPVSVGGRWIVR